MLFFMPNSKRGGIFKDASKNEIKVMSMLRRGFDAKAIAYELNINVSTVYTMIKRNGWANVILSPSERDLIAQRRIADGNAH